VGKRSTFARRPQDAYDTIDPRAVAALKPHLCGVRTFAEPCNGMSHLTRQLRAAGLTCRYENDILNGADCDALLLTPYDLEGVDAIITNPPWTRALLHALILHLQTLAPTWLLFDSGWMFTQQSVPFIDQCSHIVAVGRLRWIPDTTMTGKDDCAWHRFHSKHSGGPHFFGRVGAPQ